MRARTYLACIAGLLIAIMVATVTYTQSRAFQIPYHTKRMKSALDAHYAEPADVQGGMVGFVYGDDYERFEYHRNALVDLGVIAHIHARLENIRKDTPEYRHFSRTLVHNQDDDSPVPDFVGELAWDDKSGVLTLDVWCYSEHHSKWTDFLDSRNVRDYKETFMDHDDDAL